MLFGGMAHRRAETVARQAESVAKQVDELESAIEAVEGQLREAEARPPKPPVPGMPLPTGYGLQVRGPDDESIVLPVCLPPGFELASMVLCPEFLPRDQPQQPAAQPAAAPAPPAHARARPPRPPLPSGSASAARSSTSSATTRASASRDVRRHRRGRRAETDSHDPGSRPTASEPRHRRAEALPIAPGAAASAALRCGRVRRCAYDPADAARSRDRTRGGTARRLGRSVRTRPGAQARALADRGDPRRPDAESRPRQARPP